MSFEEGAAVHWNPLLQLGQPVEIPSTHTYSLHRARKQRRHVAERKAVEKAPVETAASEEGELGAADSPRWLGHKRMWVFLFFPTSGPPRSPACMQISTCVSTPVLVVGSTGGAASTTTLRMASESAYSGDSHHGTARICSTISITRLRRRPSISSHHQKNSFV